MSPFSTSQNYTLVPHPVRMNTPGILTDWDREVLETIKQVGAAAYFQVAPKSRQRQKLDALHRAGLCYHYTLEGSKKIKIACSKPYELDELLRTLAVTQLYVELQKIVPLEITPGNGIIHSVIYFNNQTFPIVVVRESDNIPFLTFAINNLEKTIIISEEYYPEFKNIKIPTRITTDDDLIQGNLEFKLPNGTIERLS